MTVEAVGWVSGTLSSGAGAALALIAVVAVVVVVVVVADAAAAAAAAAAVVVAAAAVRTEETGLAPLPTPLGAWQGLGCDLTMGPGCGWVKVLRVWSAGSKTVSIVVWSNWPETACTQKRSAGLVKKGTSSQRASSGQGG